jgi:hypothetical protein
MLAFSYLVGRKLFDRPLTSHTDPDQLNSTLQMTAQRSAKTFSFFGSFFSLGQQRKK